jgi:hypothetical protein
VGWDILPIASQVTVKGLGQDGKLSAEKKTPCTIQDNSASPEIISKFKIIFF